MIRKLALLGVALFIIGIAGSLLTFRTFTTQAAEPFTKEKIIAQSITNLEVSCDNAKVIIKPASDQQLKVDLTGKIAKNKNITFNTDVQGQTLHVNVKNKWHGFIDFGSITQKLTLTVYLPKKKYEDLNVLTNNGQVTFQDLTSNKIETTSQNGRLTIRHTTSKEVTAEADNGKIVLDHARGTLKGHTSNGEIDVITANLDQTMTLTCSNGRILVQTAQDPTDTRFDVHVDNGHINILNKYNDTAVIGNGTHVIKLRTDNGSIEVTKNTQ